MAKTSLSMQVWECDGCGKQFTVYPSEQPDGFHGEAYQQGSWGVAGVANWFACKEACIRKAILASLKRAEDEH